MNHYEIILMISIIFIFWRLHSSQMYINHILKTVVTIL